MAMRTGCNYEVLGIIRTATPSEIKSAHRQKAKQHHPDLGGSEEAIKRVNLAWEVLGDPAKKQNYDLREAPHRQSPSDTYAWSRPPDPSRRSTRGADSTAGTSRGYESVSKTTFRDICTCGCRGYPFGSMSWKIDLSQYGTCPARKLRKRCGFYYSDSGGYVSEDGAKTQRWARRNEARRDPEAAEKARNEKDRVRSKSRRDAANAERDAKKKKEEETRIRNGEDPLSPAEARRRGLKHYRSKSCKYGHDSLRDLKGNCLRCRELESLQRASENRANA